MRNHGELIGSVDVDSGSIFIGDPCYIVQDEAWREFSRPYIAALHKNKVFVSLEHKVGFEGKGVMACTLYGDGSYPVYAKFNKNGGIESMTIDFTQEDEDDDV